MWHEEFLPQGQHINMMLYKVLARAVQCQGWKYYVGNLTSGMEASGSNNKEGICVKYCLVVLWTDTTSGSVSWAQLEQYLK